MRCFISHPLTMHQREIIWLIFSMIFKDSYANCGIFQTLQVFLLYFQALQIHFCHTKPPLITSEMSFFNLFFFLKV